MERKKKKWTETAKKEKVYFYCFNCDFWIGVQKMEKILRRIKAYSLFRKSLKENNL